MGARLSMDDLTNCFGHNKNKIIMEVFSKQMKEQSGGGISTNGMRHAKIGVLEVK
jgi:hypothetical protein